MKLTIDSHSRGVIQILLATILWGVGYPFWKYLALELPPLVLTYLSFVIASIAFFFFYRFSPKSLFMKFKRHAWVYVFLGLSGGALGSGLLFYALAHIDSGVASLLEKLQPIFALICARIFLGEMISKKKIPFMILSLLLSIGIAIPDPLRLPLSGFFVPGVWAAIGAACFYGINTVFSKHVLNNGLAPTELAFFRLGIGALCIFPMLVLQDNLLEIILGMSIMTWTVLFLATFISLILAFDLFFRGLNSVSASEATFLEMFTPVVALALGVFVLNERLSDTQLYSIPPFVYCIYMISLSKKSKRIEKINQP